MKRLFNTPQRHALLYTSDFCKNCGGPLDQMEADHVIPFSKGGETNFRNAQALCSKCNKLKSNKIMEKQLKLKEWQEDAYKRFLKVHGEQQGDVFLCVAGVGSGKTIFASYVFNHLLRTNQFDSVIIVSPTENIKRNWAKVLELYFRIKVDHDYKFKNHWPRDCQGISISYQILSDRNIEVLTQYVTRRTLLIVDEVHHAGNNKSWGEGIQRIGELCGFKMLLTGTPDRNDNSPIPFVNYEETNGPGGTKIYTLRGIHKSYTYGQAVEDERVCPTIFQRQSAAATTIKGTTILDDETKPDINGKKLYSQIIDAKSEGNCWVYQTFEKANEKLNELNDLRNKNYGGMIVCSSISNAEILYKRIYDKYGPSFVEIVTSDDTDSSKKVEKFTHSAVPWIISINMISEGVDIPRLRVIVYASNVLTTIRFIQVMGRGVRNPEHLPNNHDVCYFYMADYRPLLENAQLIKEEIKHKYQEIEKELVDRTSGTGTPTFSIEDVVLEAQSVDSGNVFNADFWDVNEDYTATAVAKKIKASKDIVLAAWKELKVMEGKPTPEERPFEFRSTTERKKDVSRLITDLVGKIAYQLQGGKPGPEWIRKVHTELNRKAGINFSNTATEEQLQNKFKYAEQWFLNLTGKK
jgi:superfamily II DNA or RNA helicase